MSKKNVFLETIFHRFFFGLASENKAKTVICRFFFENIDFTKIVLPSRRNTHFSGLPRYMLTPSWPRATMLACVGSKLIPSSCMLAPVGLKLAEVDPKLTPSWPQVGPCWLKLAPSRTQVGPCWPMLAPSGLQVGP